MLYVYVFPIHHRFYRVYVWTCSRRRRILFELVNDFQPSSRDPIHLERCTHSRFSDDDNTKQIVQTGVFFFCLFVFAPLIPFHSVWGFPCKKKNARRRKITNKTFARLPFTIDLWLRFSVFPEGVTKWFSYTCKTKNYKIKHAYKTIWKNKYNIRQVDY